MINFDHKPTIKQVLSMDSSFVLHMELDRILNGVQTLPA